MAAKRIFGILQLQIAGEVYEARGNFTFNLGYPKLEAVAGADGMHGFKESHQPAFIEGEITDPGDLDLASLVSMRNVGVSLRLHSKTVTLSSASFVGEGTANTEEGNVPVRFESLARGVETEA